MMKEIWKDIPEYNGKYSISNKGNIKSNYYRNTTHRNEVILKSFISDNGYERITLSKDGIHKTMYIHRLVGDAFVDGKKDGLVINHIDYNRSNNISTNLEWVTPLENVLYSRDHLKGPRVNSKPTNTGEKYITFTKRKKYRLCMRFKRFDRGFDTLADALDARKRVIGW